MPDSRGGLLLGDALGCFQVDWSSLMELDEAPGAGSKLAVLLATCGGVGFSPIAPGTLGAALGIPLAIGLATLAPAVQLVLVAVIFLVGIPICDVAAKALGKEDPSEVIWDELATIPITFLFVPLASMKLWWILLAGFALHRFFDIRKISPAKEMESLHGGMGIMLDDLVAGAYSCAALHFLMYLVASFGASAA